MWAPVHDPSPDTIIAVGDILIVIGTAAELAALVALSDVTGSPDAPS